MALRQSWLVQLVWILVAWLGASAVWSQSATPHFLLSSDTPPGTVALERLLTNPQFLAEVQPVRITVPGGVIVSVPDGSHFRSVDYANPLVAMHVGPVFRFRISRIAEMPDREFFPSVELIDRLLPPADMSLRFPVEVVISVDDLKDVAAGNMVTKVVYLENPDLALPFRHTVENQPFFDVSISEDPLRTASRLGRPMAIVRIGSRLPAQQADEDGFFFHGVSPEVFPKQAAVELEQRFRQTSFQQTFTPFEPPQETTTHSNCGCHAYAFGACSPAIIGCAPAFRFAQRIPWDEYLCDGGDQGLKVKVDDEWNLFGLDPSDTIGHFDTLDGVRKVVESNRVCIYSPRFAAVRKLSLLTSESGNLRAQAVAEEQELITSRGKDFSATTVQQLQPQRNRSTTHAQSFRDRTRGVPAENTVGLLGANATFKPYNNLHLIRFGRHQGSETPRLQLGTTSAGVWQDNLGLQVMLDRSLPVLVNDVAKAQEIVTVKTDRGEAKLSLTKVASKIAATPGEEVEFTIRFDNVGGDVIGNIVLVDNLVTRLEYVADSAECSVEADFTATRNDADSLVLRWELRDPLPPGKGGIIRFKCRVR
ncbi:MAG TPA: hypothetical protein PKD54_06685 [Pirellulaceae bacterium]|nr:hypothetical protein [Pirellulaceae bacterium]